MSQVQTDPYDLFADVSVHVGTSDARVAPKLADSVI
jgi:hypothetical protein